MPYDHDAAQSLHTMLVDSRNGYETALEKTDDAGMTAFLAGMVGLRTRHSTELASRLASEGEDVSDDGSFMTVVHETVMNVRALFSGLDESALPGILDGEERMLRKYDDAIAEAEASTGLWRTLAAQREAVASVVEEIRSRIAASKR
jgi:uncharacterized protein (TIGR02284 family)